VWLQHDKNKKITNEDEAMLTFEQLVGVPWHIALKAHWALVNRKAEALRRKHRACKGETRWAAGYPGESFVICGCGEVLDYHFCRADIE